MKIKARYFIITCLLTFNYNYSQLPTNNKISSNEFFIEKQPDSITFLSEFHHKYKGAWAYVNYKTGDDSNCKERKGNFKKNNKNSFLLINKDISKTDIWVTFMRIKGNNDFIIERKCFVKFNEEFQIKNLEIGDYKLKIIHGNDWKQPIDFSCQGRFIRNYSIELVECSDIYTITQNNNLKFISTNENKSEKCN